MISMNVQLLYHERPQRSVSGFFLPGSNAQEWITSLVKSELPLETLTLYSIPVSIANRTPRGVFVRLPQRTQVPAGVYGHPYGLAGERLYLPVEASLSPSIADPEWATMPSGPETLCVWHPVAGLVAFEPTDELTIGDLLQIPDVDSGDWSQARTGLAVNHRIVSIEAPWPEASKDLLKDGADGIGSRSKDLPALRQGMGDTLTNAALGAAGMAIAPIAWIAKQLGQMLPGSSAGSGKENWLNQFGDWAEKLLRDRSRELNRLMDMLQNSPDEGLEYAIPIGGGEPTNEVARPSSRLARRSAEFNLGRMSGRGVADYWDIPPDEQFKLIKRYRELAEREVRLGRHKRAAYIYGELLNDLHTAASTLVNGGHYREAAVLYRDRLHRPLDAARCLEQGGLLHDAIVLYKDLKHYEKVGDLHLRLEESDLAETAYRSHIDDCLTRSDYLTAATALELKLHNPEEALELVQRNWTNAKQKRECLLRAFELMAKLGLHKDASKQLKDLRKTSWSTSHLVTVVQNSWDAEPPAVDALPAHYQTVVDCAAEVARTYPDRNINTEAADVTRCLVSQAVVNNSSSSMHLLKLIDQLAPEDLLLPRDTLRFRDIQNAPKPQPATSNRRAPGRKKAEHLQAKELMTRQLPPKAYWFHVEATSRSVFVCGYSEGEKLTLLTLDGDISGEMSNTNWLCGSLSYPPKLLATVDDRDTKTFVHLFASTLPVMERRIDHRVSAGRPGWIGDDTVALACSDGFTWTLESRTWSLKCFNRQGLPVSDRQLLPSASMIEDDLFKVPIHARKDGVYLGMGHELLKVSRQDKLTSIDFGQPIRSLVGSAPNTRARIAVFFEHGGVVVWPEVTGDHCMPLSDDFTNPQGVFLRDGRLIINSGANWEVYSTAGKKLEFKGELTGMPANVVGLSPLPALNQFLVWTSNGELKTYSLS